MTVEIIQGDCLEVLRTMPAESANTCVTSPPYWGLRDYGTATWVGGDEGCLHSVCNQVQDTKAPGAIISGVRPGADATTCRRCGATRVDSQIGLESSPEEYVAKIVAVLNEVRRALRDDGTLWLNLGDSYCSTAPGTKAAGPTSRSEKLQQSARLLLQDAERAKCIRPDTPMGLKPKDLVGIPWRVAFALQADGWWLRQDIIWHKPNPMPESVTDRCTKAHEYIFLLSKSERYYFDHSSIAEPAVCKKLPGRNMTDTRETYGSQNGGNSGLVALRNRLRDQGENDQTRNRRSVWTVTTKPYKGAHFATFPPDLIKPCILAGCPEGGTVLDPFMGSGTTGLVSQENGRNCIGIELNPEYIKMARQRLSQRLLI